MKLLCASDYHANHRFLESTVEHAEKLEPDVFVYCGDFVMQEYAEELIKRLEEVGVPVLAVAGNLDLGIIYESEMSEIVMYGLRELKGYHFLLVSATYPFILDEALADVEGIDPSKLIFVTHYPPKGVLDKIWSNEHVGYDGYAEFDENVKPALHVFGHIHEDNGFEIKSNTIFVNCAATPSRKIYLVDLKKREVRDVKL